MAEEIDPGTAPEGDEDPSLDEGKIEKAVRKVLGSLIGEGKVSVKDDGEGEPAKPAGRRTLREEEADLSGLVRSEVARIKAEEAHSAEHQRIKEDKEKPPVSPTKPNKARSFLWGN